MSRGRPWTSDDDATLRREVASGRGDDEIARHMDRHPKLIGRKRRDMELARGLSPIYVAMMARLNLRRRMARA